MYHPQIVLYSLTLRSELKQSKMRGQGGFCRGWASWRRRCLLLSRSGAKGGESGWQGGVPCTMTVGPDCVSRSSWQGSLRVVDLGFRSMEVGRREP
jgi:hypothetical protein